MSLLGLLAGAAAVLAWPPAAAAGLRRLPRGSTHIAAAAGAGARRWRRRLAAVTVGLVVAVGWGGVSGVIAGLLTAAGCVRLLLSAEGVEQRRLRTRRAEDLPAALDLVVVCLRAGLPVDVALSAVAEVLTGPLRADLAVVCALEELGADARAAWSELGTDPVLAPVARAMARAGGSGSALAAALAAVAEQCRGQLQEDVEVAARRVGVFVLAPLGLCFLPAFVCLGVVPTILGVAGSVLQ